MASKKGKWLDLEATKNNILGTIAVQLIVVVIGSLLTVYLINDNLLPKNEIDVKFEKNENNYHLVIKNDSSVSADDFVFESTGSRVEHFYGSFLLQEELCRGNNVFLDENFLTGFRISCGYIPPKSTIEFVVSKPVPLVGPFEDRVTAFFAIYWSKNSKSTQIVCDFDSLICSN